MHGAAGGGQHRERGREVLRLEIAVEGVGEQHDLRPAHGTDSPRALAERIGRQCGSLRRALKPAIFSDHCISRELSLRRLNSQENRDAIGA